MKQTFKFGTEDAEAFTLALNQLNLLTLQSPWVKRITSTASVKYLFSKEETHQSSDQLDEKKRKDFQKAVGQRNWVSGMIRLDTSFHTCDTSTRFKNSTVADARRMNKIIKYLKNADSFIRILQFDKNFLRLQLSTDASFNNLPNGSSQAGQIIFLSDSRNNCCPFY